MHEVVLHKVPIKALKKKVTAYRELYGSTPRISVEGNFEEHKLGGEPVFIDHAPAPVDQGKIYFSSLIVCIDGEWTQLWPTAGVIDTVTLYTPE